MPGKCGLKQIPSEYQPLGARFGQSVETFAYLEVLWDRLTPDRPRFEQIEDLIEAGVVACSVDDRCEAWWLALYWLMDAMPAWGFSSIQDLDARLNDRVILRQWIEDFVFILREEGRKRPSFLHSIIHVVNTLIRNTKLTYRAGSEILLKMVEAHYCLGETEKADRMLDRLLERFDPPERVDGWLLLAESYLNDFSPGTNRYNPKEAQRILEPLLSDPEEKENAILLSELARVYKLQGMYAKCDEMWDMIHGFQKKFEDEFEEWKRRQDSSDDASSEAFSS